MPADKPRWELTPWFLYRMSIKDVTPSSAGDSDSTAPKNVSGTIGRKPTKEQALTWRKHRHCKKMATHGWPSSREIDLPNFDSRQTGVDPDSVADAIAEFVTSRRENEGEPCRPLRSTMCYRGDLPRTLAGTALENIQILSGGRGSWSAAPLLQVTAASFLYSARSHSAFAMISATASTHSQRST